MKRSVRIAFMVGVMLLVLQIGFLGVAADGPSGSWASGIQIQNESNTEAAHITITFYWAEGEALSGQVAYSHSDTIAAGKSVAYYIPAWADFPEDFVGSAVVTSDVPVAAIVNTTLANTDSPKRLGSATGVLTPSTTIYAPYLRKNYYGRNSYIAVQNTSGSDTSVTISYRDSTGTELSSAQETANVAAYSTRVFYQNENSSLPDGFHGSATIQSTSPLAAIICDANAGTSVTTSGFESYNGFTTEDSATTVYLPKLTVNYYTYQGGFQAQNAGTEAATMTVQYVFHGETYTKVSELIQPGAAWTVYLAKSGASGLPEGLSGAGAATITSSQPLVAIAVEVNDAAGYSVVTSGVADNGTATDTVLFPKFDRRYYDYDGGIQVQNIGTSSTTVIATFSQEGLSDVVTTPVTLGVGESCAWYGPNVPGLADGFHGSVVITSDGQPIAGIYNSRNDSLEGDSYSAYNGIAR